MQLARFELKLTGHVLDEMMRTLPSIKDHIFQIVISKLTANLTFLDADPIQISKFEDDVMRFIKKHIILYNKKRKTVS